VLPCWDLYGTCIKHAHSQQSVILFHYPCLWLVAEFDSLLRGMPPKGLLALYNSHTLPLVRGRCVTGYYSNYQQVDRFFLNIYTKQSVGESPII
jgi:hypothetical protein